MVNDLRAGSDNSQSFIKPVMNKRNNKFLARRHYKGK